MAALSELRPQPPEFGFGLRKFIRDKANVICLESNLIRHKRNHVYGNAKRNFVCFKTTLLFCPLIFFWKKQTSSVPNEVSFQPNAHSSVHNECSSAPKRISPVQTELRLVQMHIRLTRTRFVQRESSRRCAGCNRFPSDGVLFGTDETFSSAMGFGCHLKDLHSNEMDFRVSESCLECLRQTFKTSG